MARPKKKIKRHNRSGVYSKKGWLYYTLPETHVVNGKVKTQERWIATKLKDSPENRQKVEELRKLKFTHSRTSLIDVNIIFSDYAILYLQEKEREVENTTYRTYRDNVNRINSFLSDIRVRDIDKKTVARFLDDLFEVKHLQKRTVEDTKAELNRICCKAVKDGILVYNPVPETKINKSLASKYTKNIPDENKVFSLDEALIFLNHAKVYINNHKRLESHVLYEMFFIIAFFGLRREEILGLKWSAINFTRKTMYIVHTVTQGTQVNRKDRTKTKDSQREYPLPDLLLKIFEQIKEKEQYYREKVGLAYKENDYIFKEDDGTQFSPSHPSKIFKKILREIPELPQDVQLRGLRGTCVSILLNYCDNPKEVQEFVGHKDITTTLEIYNKLKSRASKEKLGNIMASLLEYKPT